ncbi:hypothetical protein Adi01nite_47980 [Amorphoplanes digitatis]|nr:hypothetical protein Adi01nite_47980 [Actinoplanes digitatis]
MNGDLVSARALPPHVAAASSHPGASSRGASLRCPSGDPGPASRDAPLDRSLGAVHPSRRGRTTIMAAMPKPKPQPSDDAREQARRALQTSMDTRQ